MTSHCSSGQVRKAGKGCDGTVRLSVVSHGQDDLVERLLCSVAQQCDCSRLSVVVTRNLPGSDIHVGFSRSPFPITLRVNRKPLGFGANHNRALAGCQADYFCILNPDIFFFADVFDELLACFKEPAVGVVAPAIVGVDGKIQDSARLFPTPMRILARVFFRRKEYGLARLRGTAVLYPDWVAGMFMLFPARVYRLIGGFDESYHLYCEDADICIRLWRAGYRVLLRPDVTVCHNARRSSHGSMRYLTWHLRSLVRFFFSYPFYRL